MTSRSLRIFPLAVVTLLIAAGPARAQTSGKVLFDAHCARCHNVGGTGGEGPSLAVPVLARASTDDALADVMRSGIPNTEMPGNFTLGDAEIDALVGYVRSLARVDDVPMSGEPSRGRSIFEGKGGCDVCHMVGGAGGNLGPDLTSVGMLRGVAYLRESIVSPAASVPPRFLTVELVTADGRGVRGVRVNEDTFTMQIRDESGTYRSFEKRSLRKLDKKFEESVMPAYASELSAAEVEDLVAYLAGLKGAP